MARGRVRKGRRQAVSLVVCAYVVMTVVLLGLAAAIACDCLRWHEGPTRTLRVRSTFADELHYAFAADFSTGLGADRPAPDVQLLSGAPDDVIVRKGISTLRVGLFVPPGDILSEPRRQGRLQRYRKNLARLPYNHLPC